MNKKNFFLLCNSCGKSYKEDSIKIEQCEYCDNFYCIYCLPAHKMESHGGRRE